EFEKKNYKNAQTIARQNIQKEKLKTPAYYLIIKSQYQIGMKNRTPNIFLYIQTIDKNLKRSDDKIKAYWKKNFELDSTNFNKLKLDIANTLIDSILTFYDMNLANEFIEFYPNHQKIEAISQIRDSILYENARKENSFEAYINYTEKYPNSKYVKIIQLTMDTAWSKLYWPFQREGDLASLIAFEKYYIRYPHKEQIKKDKKNAELAEKLKLTKPYDSLIHKLYVKYLKTAKTDLNIVVLQKIMQPLLEIQDWESAVDTFAKYYIYVKHLPQAMKTIRVIKHFSQDVTIKKWPGDVNTYASEYSPVLSADGKTLYFCSMRRKESIGGEDVFYIQKKLGHWEKALLLNGVSTKLGNEAPESITADESTIVLFSGGQGGDLEYVEKTYYGWTQPNNYKEINSPYFEGEASLSADARVMLFVSDRIDNYGLYHKRNLPFYGSRWGNTDLYIAIKSVDGKWNKIERLDSIINTPYAEVSPFLHPDMKTLYFCSNGHGGLGGLDVFKTTRLYDSSWVYWSKPINLGKEINTPFDDWSYKVSTDGTFAYFARRKDHHFDIYTASLPKKLQPSPIGNIIGQLKLPDGTAIRGKIYWTQENIPGFGHFTTDFDGNYNILLPQANKYRFYVELPGVYTPPVEINLNENKPILPLLFEPVPINEMTKENTPVILERIYFDYNKSALKIESFEELERFAAFLKVNTNIKVEIIGHTDAVGKEDYNLQLSKKRAEAVTNYLLNKGIEANRIKTKGMGESQLATQSTKAKVVNRRVEFRIISN
ncbi:MAG: OmpA family protein, partial [Bacteroidales bacterium]|nr:OmpA family protein [Bacteroidales bacterium]